nr:MAG TPA: hypothetical protein [Caudoviricetes sp.]
MQRLSINIILIIYYYILSFLYFLFLLKNKKCLSRV